MLCVPFNDVGIFVSKRRHFEVDRCIMFTQRFVGVQSVCKTHLENGWFFIMQLINSW